MIDMSSRRPSRWSGSRRQWADRVIPLQRDAPSSELKVIVNIVAVLVASSVCCWIFGGWIGCSLAYSLGWLAFIFCDLWFVV